MTRPLGRGGVAAAAGRRRRLAKPALTALCLAAFLGGALGADAAAASVRAPTPEALYHALLDDPIATAALPSGFSSASTGSASAGAQALSHHVVGVVEVSIDYGGTVVLYSVFPSGRDALGAWTDAIAAAEPGAASKLTPTGFPTPALIVNGSILATNALDDDVVETGFSSLSFVDGNVTVAVTSDSTTNRSSGNLPAAEALGRLALAHLNAVEHRLAAG